MDRSVCVLEGTSRSPRISSSALAGLTLGGRGKLLRNAQACHCREVVVIVVALVVRVTGPRRRVALLCGGGVLSPVDGDDLRERERHVADGRAAVAGVEDTPVELLEGEVAAQVGAHGGEGGGGGGHALRGGVRHVDGHVEHPVGAHGLDLIEWRQGCARCL